jgi:hypothetical protein
MLSIQLRMRTCAGRRAMCAQPMPPSPSIVTMRETFSGKLPAYCSVTPPPSECAIIVYGARPIASPSAWMSSA